MSPLPESLPPKGGSVDVKPEFAGMLVDLDGTLMVTDTISSRVADAVKEVAQHIPVCIATGRRSSDVLRYANQLGLKSPQICNGGATILTPPDGQITWNIGLPAHRAREIVDLLTERGTYFIATHPAGDSFSREEVQHWDLTRISAMDIPESEADDLMAAFSDADDLHLVKVYLHYNGWWAVDFTAAGIHKGEAARVLAEQMGVSPERFIAAGDSFNDLPMLEIAGFRIAMASAPREMKDLADFVAPPVEEDGLAVAIEEAVITKLLGIRT